MTLFPCTSHFISLFIIHYNWLEKVIMNFFIYLFICISDFQYLLSLKSVTSVSCKNIGFYLLQRTTDLSQHTKFTPKLLVLVVTMKLWEVIAFISWYTLVSKVTINFRGYISASYTICSNNVTSSFINCNLSSCFLKLYQGLSGLP